MSTILAIWFPIISLNLLVIGWKIGKLTETIEKHLAERKENDANQDA